MPSLSDPTSPSPDIDNLESTLPPNHPDAEYLESDNNVASDETKETKEPKQPELPPVWVNEQNLEGTSEGEKRPSLLVKEVLCQVRAIFVEYVKKVGVRPVSHNLDIAHRVFEGLRKEMVLVRQGGVKPQLQWLRFSVSVWSGIQDIDAPGMFPLS
ncbi:uncharacterized protein PAC_15478 [Phialocephala subalpina]|uniref:Uncharacterized protein n=1 Tax=Phialocephala subalpina TaxID=576137 RepID=A0A1L7XKN1_9HELO|nr:uncharacterized protein PAC_15478 [Phialocephala subalpina]